MYVGQTATIQLPQPVDDDVNDEVTINLVFTDDQDTWIRLDADSLEITFAPESEKQAGLKRI